MNTQLYVPVDIIDHFFLLIEMITAEFLRIDWRQLLQRVSYVAVCIYLFAFGFLVVSWCARKSAQAVVGFITSCLEVLWSAVSFVHRKLVYDPVLRMWYGVSNVPSEPLFKVVSPQGYDFPDGKPHLKIEIDGQTYWVRMDPLVAFMTGGYQQHGKESPMAGSNFVNVNQPDNVVTFWIGDKFIGCGFRAVAFGRTNLYTANHVYVNMVGRDDVLVRFKNQVAKMPPLGVFSRGESEEHDFVVLNDSRLFTAWGVKVLKSSSYADTAISTVGTRDGSNWYLASGRSFAKKMIAFVFNHESSTQVGWSGSPILNGSGDVVGIHTGSVPLNGKIINTGTAVFDLLFALRGANKLKVLESYEEYQKSAWSNDTQLEVPGRKMDFYYSDQFTGLTLNNTGYSWADNESEVDFEEELSFDDFIKEDALDKDFQSGLGTEDAHTACNTTNNTPNAKDSMEQGKNGTEHRHVHLDPLLHSENTESTILGKKKRTRSSKKSKKSNEPAMVLLNGLDDLEQLSLLELENLVSQRKSMLLSQKPATSLGQISKEKDCSPVSDTTVPCLNKTVLPPTHEQLIVPSIKPLEKSKKAGTSFTNEEKMTFILTRQYHVKELKPNQLQQKTNLQNLLMESPEDFERKFLSALAIKREHNLLRKLERA